MPAISNVSVWRSHGLHNARYGRMNDDGSFTELGELSSHVERVTTEGDNELVRTVSFEVPIITLEYGNLTADDWAILSDMVLGEGHVLIEKPSQPSNAPSLGGQHRDNSPMLGGNRRLTPTDETA